MQKWQDKREGAMKRKYFRMLKKEGFTSNSKNPNLIPLGSGKQQEQEKTDATTLKDQPKPASYKTAKLEFERRQKVAEKKQKQEERKQKFLEKEAAKKAYREKKLDRTKILNKKTRKGQPLMAGRMELLYEKIKLQENS